MPSMMDAIKEMLRSDSSSFDSMLPYTTKSKMKGDYAKKIEDMTSEVVSGYYAGRGSLNHLIAGVASRGDMSSEQINRLIQEVNNEIYLTEYEKTKGKTDRYVSFPIASLSAIKDLMGNQSKVNSQPAKESIIPEEGGSKPMDKKASIVESEDLEKLDFLNCSKYSIGSLSAEKTTPQETFLRRELAEKIASINSETEKLERSFADSLRTLTDALIGYDKLAFDAQGIFQEVCKQAALSWASQDEIVKFSQERVDELIESRSLPKSFGMHLESIGPAKEDSAFSLGAHSLRKEAEEKDKTLPTISSNKNMIRNYKDLVRVAQRIQAQQEALAKAKAKQQKIASLIEAE